MYCTTSVGLTITLLTYIHGGLPPYMLARKRSKERRGGGIEEERKPLFGTIVWSLPLNLLLFSFLGLPCLHCSLLSTYHLHTFPLQILLAVLLSANDPFSFLHGKAIGEGLKKIEESPSSSFSSSFSIASVIIILGITQGKVKWEEI